jgi:hypothetical protein
MRKLKYPKQWKEVGNIYSILPVIVKTDYY